MIDFPDLSGAEGFDWDRGNVQKNWARRRVAFHECEEVFFHEPVLVPDPDHSGSEQRWFAFGRTAKGRLLTIVFTIRKNTIRVISARDMSRKERGKYEEL